MTELEQKLADSFRRNGNRLLSMLPDWPNSEIAFGDAIDLARAVITYRPRLCHHVFTLTVDGMLRVQEFGTETFEDAVLVDALVVSDRKADGGPIWLLTGFRKMFDMAGWASWLVMRAVDGTFISQQPSGRSPSARSRDLTAVRKRRRRWEETVGTIDWTAVRHHPDLPGCGDYIRMGRLVSVWSVQNIAWYHPSLMDGELALPIEERSRVRVTSAWMRDGHVGDSVPDGGVPRALVHLTVIRAKDGTWITGDMRDLRSYEEALGDTDQAESSIVESDPEAGLMFM